MLQIVSWEDSVVEKGVYPEYNIALSRLDADIRRLVVRLDERKNQIIKWEDRLSLDSASRVLSPKSSSDEGFVLVHFHSVN